MTLRHQLGPFAASGRKAYRIAGGLFDAIIITLRRDQRFADIKAYELDLLLADVRSDAEQRLFDEMVGRVHLDDIDIVDDGGRQRSLTTTSPSTIPRSGRQPFAQERSRPCRGDATRVYGQHHFYRRDHPHQRFPQLVGPSPDASGKATQ
jgi:hypothetical protein